MTCGSAPARPAATLYALAGSPPQERVVDLTEPVRCRVCAGLTARAAPYERWQGANFTDQNKLRWIDGRHVCEACIWAHAWNPPPGAPAAEPGKKGLNLRLFSHLYDARGYAARLAGTERVTVLEHGPRSLLVAVEADADEDDCLGEAEIHVAEQLASEPDPIDTLRRTLELVSQEGWEDGEDGPRERVLVRVTLPR